MWRRVLLLVVLLSGPLAAMVEGDLRLLYWRNVDNDVRYAISLPALIAVNSPPATPQVAQPIYAWGWGGTVRFTMPSRPVFFAIDTASVAALVHDKAGAPPAPGTLIPVFDPPNANIVNFATIEWKLVYRHVDGVAGFRLPTSIRGVRIGIAGGVRYARFRFDEKIFYDVIPALPIIPPYVVRQRHSFEGVGPRLAARMCWSPFTQRWFDGARVEGHIGLSGIVGDQLLSITGPSGTFGGTASVNGNQTAPRQFLLVPAFDVAIAGGYRLDLRRFWLGIDVGYELNYYFQADRRWPSSQLNLSEMVRFNVGYGGPFFRIRGGF